MWTFARDFLKKGDLDLKMWTFYTYLDLHVGSSEKSGPRHDKCGLLPQPENEDRYTSFPEKVDLYLRNVDL